MFFNVQRFFFNLTKIDNGILQLLIITLCYFIIKINQFTAKITNNFNMIKLTYQKTILRK